MPIITNGAGAQIIINGKLMGYGGVRETFIAEVLSDIPADENLTASGGSPNIDSALGDYSGISLDFLENVSIYLNGQRMRLGTSGGDNQDVYPGDDPSAGEIKFTRQLRIGDQIYMDIFTPA